MGVGVEELWRRIVELEREFLRTAKGLAFTYRIDGSDVLPSHTELRIPRRDFEMAFPLLPLADPRKLAKFVTGHDYVYAILHDERIRRGDW